jgi:hypothetical protein
MSAHEWNMWVCFFLFGIPFACLAGPFAWAAVWTLAALAALATHPFVALAIGVLWLLRVPLRWLAEGLLIGMGLRAAGVFNSQQRAEAMREKFVQRRARSRHWTRSAPRSRGRRPPDYMPFDDPLDGIGE